MLTALWGVILDTEQTLRSTTPDAAKLSAIASYIEERVPGHAPGPGVAWGSTDEVIANLAARLIRADGPATDVFARVTGSPIDLRVIGPHVRPPDAEEQQVLRLRESDRLYVRDGYLMAGTIQCAKVTLKLAPDRIVTLASASAWEAIRSGTPCGTVLGPYGLRRPVRRVEICPGQARVIRCRSVLYLGALPAGLSSEEVPDSLCARLAQSFR